MNSSPFSLHTKFLPEDAGEDKVDLELSGWEIYGLSSDHENTYQFKQWMSSPPAGQEDMAWPESNKPPLYGWFFLRPALKGKDRDKLLIRRQSLSDKPNHRRYEAPLCGGYGLFYLDKKPQPITGERVHRVKLRLALNLQRFLRHQPLKEDNPILPAKPRLQNRRDDRSFHDDEFAFDGEDNWIPATPEWQKLTATDNWESYLDVISQQVDADLKRACKWKTGFDVSTPGDWHEVECSRESRGYGLSMVETLWEFPSSNPLMDVIEIGTKLLHLKRKSGTAKLKDMHFKEAGRILNSPCFSIPLAEGVKLKLYAKTNQRIRFEVVHFDLTKHRKKLLGAAGISPEGDRVWNELPGLIAAVRKLAAGHMNQLLEELRKGKAAVKAFSVVHLLAEVTGAVSSFNVIGETRFSQIQTLLIWICFFKGYRGGLKKSPYGDALATLESRGVLKYDKVRQFYVLADAYMKASDSLISVTGEPLLSLFGTQFGGYAIGEDGRATRLRE